ncbi:MAG: glycine oxidase ThiO [Rubricoccaceae bacterium]
MDSNRSILVVGGGVIGLATAWRLAQRGHAITLIERDTLGQGTSWDAAGMLAPAAELGFEELDLYALGRESLRRWPDFARQLEANTGQSLGYRDEGTLVVADDRDSAAALRRLYQFQHEHGAPVEWWTIDQAIGLEPLLSPRLPAAVWSPDDHQVDNRQLVRALAKAVREAGVTVHESTTVTAIVPHETRPAVRLAEGRQLEADVVVLAAGVGAATIDGLVPAPPVRPVKGQALSLRMTGALALRHVVRGPDAYLVPKSDGRLVVGATSEEMGADVRVTGGGLYRILEGAVEVVPAVEEMEVIETWAGLRPASRDHAPLIGASAHPGVVYATGHYRHGILLAPVTAEWVADAVEGLLGGRDETAALREPFSPLRFAGQ